MKMSSKGTGYDLIMSFDYRSRVGWRSCCASGRSVHRYGNDGDIEIHSISTNVVFGKHSEWKFNALDMKSFIHRTYHYRITRIALHACNFK